MKKIVLLLLLSFLVGSSAFAQSPFTFGPSIGAGVSLMSIDTTLTADDDHDHDHDDDDDDDHHKHYNMVGSYTLGGFARLDFDRVYLQGEAYYKVVGETFSAATRLGDVDTSQFHMQSLGVPIIFGLSPLNGKVGNLRVFGGLLYTKLLNVEDNAYLKSRGIEEIDDQDWGYLFGVGFDLGPVTIDANIEGGVGYLNTLTDQEDMMTGNVKLSFKLF